MCAGAGGPTMQAMATNLRTPTAAPTGPLRRWMQITGAFYLLQFVMLVLVRAPIRTFGPEGTLDRAGRGDELAKFTVDTWTFFGLEILAVGVILLLATRRGALALGAIYTVLAIEISRGIVADLYQVARRVHTGGYLVWIVIHTTVLVTGVLCLRDARRRNALPQAAPAPAVS
jgi:hypothetical protein